MTTTNETVDLTVDLGNNESMSRGVYARADGTWLAMTFTKSRTFKTEKGAREWLARVSAR